MGHNSLHSEFISGYDLILDMMLLGIIVRCQVFSAVWRLTARMPLFMQQKREHCVRVKCLLFFAKVLKKSVE